MQNTTAFTLTGQRITKELGTVRGIVVRSRSIIYTELCEHARQDAYERLCAHASALGANAIIGLRYDATEVMGGVTEVLCYGTAVVVEPA